MALSQKALALEKGQITFYVDGLSHILLAQFE